MKSTFISREKNEISFKMEVTAEDFEGAVDKSYKKNKEKYVVDGFRKGKAPRKIIEAKYGQEVFMEEAINDLFAEGYPKALDELNINPVSRPTVDFDKVEAGKGFEVRVKVTVAPEFSVKDYKGVKVTKSEIKVNDEDIETELNALQKRNARMIIADRPAKEGDTVLIDYAGFVGEEQFEGGTAERQPLTLGSKTFIPGFEEQLTGVTAGEERDVKVVFPEDYHAKDLAGKEAVFKCKVHEIKETELPEINDDFAKDVSEFDTLDELKNSIKEKLEKNAKDRAEYETKNAVLEKVYEANEIEIPDVMVENQIDDMLQEFDQQLRYQGMDLKKYMEYLNKDEKDFREDFRADAYKKVKTGLLVEAVAKAENIKASEEEIQNEMTAMADLYKMDIEKLKSMIKDENMEYLKKDIENRKAVDFMFENAIIE